MGTRKNIKNYADAGADIKYLPGNIGLVCKEISNDIPRRLLIGIYESRSFFRAQPSSKYPSCGFDEYLKNHEILGNELLMDWMRYSPGGIFTSCGIRSLVRSSDQQKNKHNIKKFLRSFHRSISDRNETDVACLQVIGRLEKQQGFFLSHWYTQSGFITMLREAFPPTLFSIKKYQFPKGALFVIDPLRHQPVGIITILNNVIGNVLPQDQLSTLQAVRRLVL